jgi:hypothetical protein
MGWAGWVPRVRLVWWCFEWRAAVERGDRSLTLSHTFPLPLQAKMVAWTNTAGAGAGCLLLQAALNGNRSGSGVELWKFQDICGDSPHTTTRLLRLPGLGLEALRSTSLSLLSRGPRVGDHATALRNTAALMSAGTLFRPNGIVSCLCTRKDQVNDAP